MSVLDDVFASLRAISLVQLLLAFVACTGYALAQGGLVSAKARRIAGSGSHQRAAQLRIPSRRHSSG